MKTRGSAYNRLGTTMPSPPLTDDERASMRRLLAERFARLAPPLRAPNQVLGRRSTIGCVALEITQRCNLDCTLCYLSDYSESVPDPPLGELKAKLDRIKALFGPRTNVQITGGDPTLRKRSELVEIVRYCSSIGLMPALFTNGIRASRDLLAELKDAGLVDLALHVDLTQERKGYATEMQLNEVREKYLARARGLGLAIIFNTTVFADNAREIPELVRWFVSKDGEIGMASFQLGADTGRGVVRRRGEELTMAQVRELIAEGCGAPLSWDALLVGHPRCHSLVYTLVAGGRVVDLFSERDDTQMVERWLRDFGALEIDRTRPIQGAMAMLAHVMRTDPRWLVELARWTARLGARLAPGLVRSRGRAGKLSFFIQNFQDAGALEAERIDNCSFHVATRDGSVSMCEHNARRDDFIIPVDLVRGVHIKPSRPPIAAVHAATRSE
jgi:pyruvate-formate lyase-activating enzyme